MGSLKRAFKRDRCCLPARTNGLGDVNAYLWCIKLYSCLIAKCDCVPAPQGYILPTCSGCRQVPQMCLPPPSSSSSLLPFSTCQTLPAPELPANTSACLVLMDRDSWSGNTKCLSMQPHTYKHTHTHTILLKEGATRAAEQINNFTSQLAHSAEEMALTGLLLPFFSVYVCRPIHNECECIGCLWSNS